MRLKPGVRGELPSIFNIVLFNKKVNILTFVDCQRPWFEASWDLEKLLPGIHNFYSCAVGESAYRNNTITNNA